MQSQTSYGGGTKFCLVAAAVAVLLSLPKSTGIEYSKTLGLLGMDDTLGRGNLVPCLIIAIRIHHILLPKTLHFGPISGGDDATQNWGGVAS